MTGSFGLPRWLAVHRPALWPLTLSALLSACRGNSLSEWLPSACPLDHTLRAPLVLTCERPAAPQVAFLCLKGLALDSVGYGSAKKVWSRPCWAPAEAGRARGLCVPGQLGYFLLLCISCALSQNHGSPAPDHMGAARPPPPRQGSARPLLLASLTYQCLEWPRILGCRTRAT